MVALLHPEWDRSCADCEKYLIKEDGTVLINRRTSLPLLRTREPTPCHKCPKIPLAVRKSGGDPRKMRQLAADLSEQDVKSWEFYKRCRAVDRFPVDPIVEWVAAILRDVYDSADRAPVRRMVAGIEELTRHLIAKGR